MINSRPVIFFALLIILCFCLQYCQYDARSNSPRVNSPVAELQNHPPLQATHVESSSMRSPPSSPVSYSSFTFPSYNVTSFEDSIFPTVSRQVVEASAAVFSRAFSFRSSHSVFETSYQKIDCGAIISNFCIWKGQPRYFRNGSRFFSSTGATRCCNEAESKFRFHSVMAEPLVFSSRSRDFPAPYLPDTLVVAPMCWEQYGYHLFICLLNTWSVMSQLRRVGPDGNQPKHVRIALLKSWSGQNQLGSASDWWDGKRAGASSSSAVVTTTSVFWAWWSVVADRPSDVVDLASLPTMCVPCGLVAGKLEIITPGMQQSFRQAMIRRLLTNESSQSDVGRRSVRVTIVDRDKTFRLLNGRQLVKQFEQISMGAPVEARVVVFEKLSLKEQMVIAANTDVLVGMHGNGLTWCAFMRPGTSALIELWPSHVYNGNYAHFAGRGNIKKWNVIGNATCSKRCSASISVPDAVVRDAVDFVIETKIEKRSVYKGDEEYLRAQAEYARRKKTRSEK